MKIISQKEVYKGRLIVEEGTLEHEGKHYMREKLVREDATAILILNTDKKSFILTRQFRFAIAGKITGELLEIPAGKIDQGESPESCAIRETEEETGYRIPKDNLRKIASCFVSPGYTSEKFHLFFATVSNKDNVSSNRGLKNEGEFIELVELTEAELLKQLNDNKLEDCKTLLAALWYFRQNQINKS